MATTAGVGYSERPGSTEAGTEAARAAMDQAGTNRCDLAVLFSTSKHDQHLLYEAVRAVVGPDARIAGGSGIGVITTNRLGYEGCQVGVAVLSSDSVQVDVFSEVGLPDNEYDVGRALGKQVAAADYAGEPNIVLMYDAVKRPAVEGLVLNKATPLLAGMAEALGTWPPVAGCGLVGDLQWTRTGQWVDGRLEQQAALALVLSGSVRMDTVTLNGLKPMSSYHTVTETDGDAVLAIDGRPALDVIDQLLGPNSYPGWEDSPVFIVLGVNKGDKFGEFREEDYANQLCIGIDRQRKALLMVEPNLHAGDEVQLMRRGIDFDYIRDRVEALFTQVGQRRPVLGLYIDCAGRTGVSAGTQGEEAGEVQQALAGRVPMIGMYSGTEIARVGADVHAQNWTGVLCVFSE